MINYIILNGVKSNTINGLLISKLPPITKPALKTRVDEIEGKDGDIVTPIGYAAYDKTFEIGLYGNFDIDEIIKYFDSSGLVTFSNEDDKYYRYQIIERIDFEKLIRFKTATVTMHVQPFKYSLVDQTKTFLINNQLLNFTDFTKTTSGITVTVSDGVVLVSGTSTAATEFYIPIPAVTLPAANYVLNAYASGAGVSTCSFRLIYNSPSAANSFGGTYATLQNENTVKINANLTWTQTYNYLYFYITSGAVTDFSVDFFLEDTDKDDIAIRNNGNIESKPIMTIYGTGTIDIGLNGYQVFKINMGAEGYITINSEQMEAYKDGVLKNRLVTGDYENLTLNIGKNTIYAVGEVSKIEFENYSRWI